jgi:hypothetical protein
VVVQVGDQAEQFEGALPGDADLVFDDSDVSGARVSDPSIEQASSSPTVTAR